MFRSFTHFDAIALAACALLPWAAGCGLAAQGHNVQGVQYFQQGNYQAALARFQEAQRTDPQNPDSYYNQAAALHKRGLQTANSIDLQQAESLYNTCLKFNPNHVDCHRALAVLLTETGRTQQAFTLLDTWARTNPQSADARVELARLNEELGRNSEAETYLTQALQIDINNWRAHAALGRQRELAGRFADARDNYDRAARLNPYQPQLVAKVQELNLKLASSALPSTNSQATSNGANGYNWSIPASNAPTNIIANPVRSPLGTTSASAPNRDIRY